MVASRSAIPWVSIATIATIAVILSCQSRPGGEDGGEDSGGASTPAQPTPARVQERTAPAYEGPPKTVLVELFSSQGCDSCPKADAFIGELAKLGWTTDQVVPLTFHVTYWDDLGWQDPFASQMFDQRQIGYAQNLPHARADDETTIKGPYTPQMVVDGKVHFSGSLEDVARREIESATRNATVIDLTTTTKVAAADGGRKVVVSVASSATADAGLDTDRSKIGLFAALTQKHVETEVPRGENAGKKLQEFSVVRAFNGPKLFRSSRDRNETRFDLPIPEDVEPEQLDVVVFAQDLASLGILATRAVSVAGDASAPPDMAPG